LGRVQVAHLTWSPDGTTIAYTGGETQPDRGIWLVEADGTNARQLTATAAPQASHGIGVVWSPRGDLIAFQRVCAEPPDLRYEREHPGSDVTDLVPGAPCREQEEVVLVTATDSDPASPIGTETVIPPPQTGAED
jgi:dipeptidyl aminopeptidase/acylaminoacyl peptidase